MAAKQFTPDGGWGWVVVFGSFLIHVITDGITYSFGVMVVELLETFGNNNFLTSWICSILVGVTLSSGPLSSALANRYSCRTVSMAGSIISAVGSFISAFATGIPYLIVSVGIIMGAGFGMMFCPSVLIVNMYFEKKRAVAIGMAVCGAGIGTFVFSPLTAYFFEQYTWRGTFIIYSGIILNGVVCACVFRPVEFVQVTAAPAVCDESNVGDAKELLEPIEEGVPTQNGTAAKPKRPVRQQDSSALDDTLDDAKKKSQFVQFIGTDGEPALNKQIQATSEQYIKPKQKFRHRSETVTLGTQKETRKAMEEQLANRVVHPGSQVMIVRLRPLQRKDIFFSGTVSNLTSYNQTPFVYIVHRRERDRQKSIVSAGGLEKEVEEIADVREITKPKSSYLSALWQDIRISLMQLMDLSIMRDSVYLLFAISNFLTNIGYDLPRVFLVEHALKFDIPESQGSWLLSAWGISNTAGRVLIGWMSDQPWAVNHRLMIYNISLLCCGLVNMITPWCQDFLSLLVYSSLFGLTLSTYISLTSVVLVDLLGIERLTSAYGLLLFFQGIAAVVGPPIGGFIVDSIGTYTTAFIFAGIVIFISGAMLVPIPCIQKSAHNYAVANKDENHIDNNSKQPIV